MRKDITEYRIEMSINYQCTHCDADFKKEFNLNNHKRKHTGELTCDVCQKAFSDSKFFELHKRKHQNLENGEKFKKYICHICSNGFSKTCNLKKHISKHPALEISLEEMKLRMKDYDHRFRLTDGNGQKIKSFFCVICEKNFTRIGYLKVHLKGHLEGYKGPRPKYSCQFKLKAARRGIEVNLSNVLSFQLFIHNLRWELQWHPKSLM